MDQMTEKLFRLDVSKLGLEPDQDETYVAIVMKNLLLRYRQEQRIKIITRILKPKDFRIFVDEAAGSAHIYVFSARVSTKALRSLVDQGCRIALSELEGDSAASGSDAEAEAVFGESLRKLAGGKIKSACRSFDPEKADHAFIKFLFALYSLIVGT